MATVADILGVNGKHKIPARWTKHYQRLCAERDRLSERDCSSPESPGIKLDDMAEAAAEESQQCMSLIAVKATQAGLADVLIAIRRIERGTYGTCELTGKPIEASRLNAIPWTRYSLEAQKQLEKAGCGHKCALPALEGVSKPDEEEAGPEEDAEQKQAA